MASFKNTMINDTGYLRLASGTLAQRPASPAVGMTRYNSTNKAFEFYDGSYWNWLDLTLLASYAPNTDLISIDADIRSNDITFACNLTFSTTSSSGLIYEQGAYLTGHSVFIDSSGNLRLQAGDGLASPDPTISVLVINSADVPFDSSSHELVWDIRVNPGRLRCWIDGALIGTSNTSTGGELEGGLWAGNNSGGYGTSSSLVPGEVTLPDWESVTGRTLDSNLRQ